MSVNLQKIKKWTNMMLGKSSYHVNQDEGKYYSKTEIRGYYNNLTEKITRFGKEGVLVPTTIVDTGEEIYFPIAIFQYGLAAYDLYLERQDEKMRSIVIACSDWAVENQDDFGRWNTFMYENPDSPYSSMSQAEAISLLIRANHLTNTNRYESTIEKSYKYMIVPLEEGGTAKYVGEDVYFYECPADPLILNGWIFSIWGIWDYAKEYHDVNAEELLNRTISSLVKSLPKFDLGYWSKYEDGIRISSPFYHNLHVSQLKVMSELTGISTFMEYAEKWDAYQGNRMNRWRAFIKKAIQKVAE